MECRYWSTEIKDKGILPYLIYNNFWNRDERF